MSAGRCIAASLTKAEPLAPSTSNHAKLRLLHGPLLALAVALAGPAVAMLKTPLADGAYRAVRGYKVPKDGCPDRIEIDFVNVAAGAIRFESGGSVWSGTISPDNGVIRIERGGVDPRPSAALNIRGHFRNAELFSGVCGSGYFRILR